MCFRDDENQADAMKTFNSIGHLLNEYVNFYPSGSSANMSLTLCFTNEDIVKASVHTSVRPSRYLLLTIGWNLTETCAT